MSGVETCAACQVRVIRSPSGRCPACGDGGVDVPPPPDEVAIVSDTALYLLVRAPPELPRYCACCCARTSLAPIGLRVRGGAELSAWTCTACADHLRGGRDLAGLQSALWVAFVAVTIYAYFERSWSVLVGLALVVALVWVDTVRRRTPPPRPVGPGHAGPLSLRWILDRGALSSCNARLIEDVRRATVASAEEEQLVLRALHAGVEVFFNPYEPERVRALLQSFRAGAITLEREQDGNIAYADLDDDAKARFTMEHIEASMERQRAQLAKGRVVAP